MKAIKDFRYKEGMKVDEFVDRIGTIGFQSLHVGKAVEIITKMKQEKAKIILTFTSNMVSSGLRGFFAQLIEKKFVDVAITTVGSIEEDLIKANGKEFLQGSFDVDDEQLGKEGINRIGNIYVPNEVYGSFEDIITPILEELYAKKKKWGVSELLFELGRFVTDEHSILYQARKQNIPLFCPAITDGALGLQIYFFKQKHPDFEIEVTSDMSLLFGSVIEASKVGCIVLGGGVAKHHAILANLLRDGMDYVVYMTTAHAHAGSLSGATTSEAKSWGKIKGEGDAITVIGDVSITFPLVMTRVLGKN
jgi:deoxyhypusine synthase